MSRVFDVDATSREISEGLAFQVEQRLAVVIKPRPSWLPRPLWNRLVRRLIVVELTSPSMRLVKPKAGPPPPPLEALPERFEQKPRWDSEVRP